MLVLVLVVQVIVTIVPAAAVESESRSLNGSYDDVDPEEDSIILEGINLHGVFRVYFSSKY